jgi:phosphoesterase RecJ-like protein
MHRSVKQQIVQRLQQAERPLLICHFSPDGDALGAMLGLTLALQKIDKHPDAACQDPVPTTFYYLPGADHVLSQPTGKYDLVISLDCSDVRRMGLPYQSLSARNKDVPTINIDHHVTNLNFGELNWVDPTAVAAAEMVLELIEAMDVPLDADIAVCLLTGIISDTRGFRTANMSAKVMAATTRLMEAGACLTEITDHVFNQRPLAAVRLWAQVLPETHLEGRILWGVITQEMRARSNYTTDGDAGLVSFLGDVNEADIAVVLTEKDNDEIDVSMRANPGLDVSQVALSLGGGGHPQAAGCTLKITLQEALSIVLPTLQTAWREQTGQ